MRCKRSPLKEKFQIKIMLNFYLTLINKVEKVESSCKNIKSFIYVFCYLFATLILSLNFSGNTIIDKIFFIFEVK